MQQEEEEQYLETGRTFTNAVEGQLFGKPCFKIRGKAFICFFRNSMVFKLHGTAHTLGLSLEGAVLFDPSAKGRPMKEWVQVPFQHKDRWPELASAAYAYVSEG